MTTLGLKLLLLPLLLAQARGARVRAPLLPEAAGPRSGSVGDGPLLRLLMVGDSSAAGVGVPTQDLAFVLPLSIRIAQAAGVRVAWRLVARTGTTSADALALIEQADPGPCDIALVVLGVNDVVAQVPPRTVVAQRAELTDWLRTRTGARHVAHTPLPPMHQFPLLPQPLRWIAGRDARRIDAAMARWTADRDDVSQVPIALSLGPDVMAADGFHPGEPVYRACAEAAAHHLVASVWPRLNLSVRTSAAGAASLRA